MTERLISSIDREEAFAICQLPGTTSALEFFQNGNDLVDEYGRIWIAKPFNDDPSVSTEAESTTKEKHIAVVSKAIHHLQGGDLEKVVISKIKKVQLPVAINSTSIQRAFDILTSLYPSAFIFIYRMNVHSVWVGATPETLIELENGFYKTMSLAGTRLKSDQDKPWGEKEIREQKVVTDFIASTILNNQGENLEISEPFTATAAHLEHLKSLIQFKSSQGLHAWASLLHPTPAICGLPIDQAKKLISQLEAHSRKMYAGYIGFVENSGNGKAFVQLRCMEWINQEAVIYSGGGIMPDSIPESEWEEAENKANVMLSVLEMLKN